MTTKPPPPTSHRESAATLAIRLGFLWQAVFSVAMLRHYVRHGSSFYLSDIASAWPYVHQHLLWIGAFLALGLGQRGLARALAGGGAFLALVQVVSSAHGGASLSVVLTAGGVACFGVLPAIALLVPAATFVVHRRLDWLSSGLVAAAVVSLLDDGVAEMASGGMRIGPFGWNGVLGGVWVGWAACILAFAWQGRSDRRSRLAALASTGHLMVVELVWLASAVAVRLDTPHRGIPMHLPLTNLLRVLGLAAICIIVSLLSWPALPSPPDATNSRGAVARRLTVR
jgi:hypothetical protein